jgi:hypothetical protein
MNIIISNQCVLIDDEDHIYFKSHQWHIHKCKTNLYLRGYKKGNRKNGLIYYHRMITNAPKNMDVDHINGNGLDNTKDNLRICNRSQNNANRKAVQSKSSNFKGVHFEKHSKKWRAEITKDGVRYTLGRFLNQNDALNAYMKKSKELFGEYCSLGMK